MSQYLLPYYERTIYHINPATRTSSEIKIIKYTYLHTLRIQHNQEKEYSNMDMEWNKILFICLGNK